MSITKLLNVTNRESDRTIRVETLQVDGAVQLGGVADFFEQVVVADYFVGVGTGGYTAVSEVVNVTFTKIGGVVFVSIPDFTIDAGTTKSVDVGYFNGAIPDKFNGIVYPLAEITGFTNSTNPAADYHAIKFVFSPNTLSNQLNFTVVDSTPAYFEDGVVTVHQVCLTGNMF